MCRFVSYQIVNSLSSEIPLFFEFPELPPLDCVLVGTHLVNCCKLATVECTGSRDLSSLALW